MPRILALDYGKKRTGIAVTDELQLIASGLMTISTSELLDFLKKYIEKEEVITIVVGQPRRMDNSFSDVEIEIKKVIKKITAIFPKINIIRIDERFTSKLAFKTMIDSGLKKKQRRNKSLIDEISATIILQSYLYYK